MTHIQETNAAWGENLVQTAVKTEEDEVQGLSLMAAEEIPDISPYRAEIKTKRMEVEKAEVSPFLASSMIREVKTVPTSSIQPMMLKVGVDTPNKIVLIPFMIPANKSPAPFSASSSLAPPTDASHMHRVQTVGGCNLLTNVVSGSKAIPSKPVIFLSESQGMAAPTPRLALVVPSAPYVTPLMSASMPQPIIHNPTQSQAPQPVVSGIMNQSVATTTATTTYAASLVAFSPMRNERKVSGVASSHIVTPGLSQAPLPEQPSCLNIGLNEEPVGQGSGDIAITAKTEPADAEEGKCMGEGIKTPILDDVLLHVPIREKATNEQCDFQARDNFKYKEGNQKQLTNPLILPTTIIKHKAVIPKKRQRATQHNDRSNVLIPGYVDVKNFVSCHTMKLAPNTLVKMMHQLNHNIANLSRETLYVCHLCKASFNQKSQLSSHMETHERKAHMEIYKVEDPLQCRMCEKFSFATERKMLHTRVFRCKVCCQLFCCRTTQLAHQRSDSCKPYSCSRCGRTFTHLLGLIRHGKTHVG